MSNVSYRFSDDGIGYGTLPGGETFLFDADLYERIKDFNWYRSNNSTPDAKTYIMNRNGELLHQYLFDYPKGFEVDHISLDTFDNRRSNIRICTHQQNQCNQPLQRNNTSGASGVRYYAPRGKYHARIKIGQHDVHLGYYKTFEQAAQARNVGMECMFGEYGRYNNVPPAPNWIRKKVIKQCLRFAELSLCKAFLISMGNGLEEAQDG